VREETISVHPTFASLLSKLAAAWSEIQETIILRWLANLLSNTCYNFSSPNQLLSFFSVLLIQEIIISIINHPEKLMMTKGINITRAEMTSGTRQRLSSHHGTERRVALRLDPQRVPRQILRAWPSSRSSSLSPEAFLFPTRRKNITDAAVLWPRSRYPAAEQR
jgi:hypothetical protein